MVKSLLDVCLTQVAARLQDYKELSLSREQCETLIKRMCAHNQLDTERLPSVSRFLFVPFLRTLSLASSPLVTDDVLYSIGVSSIKLRSIRIQKCKHVTDTGVVALLHQQDDLEHLLLRSLPSVTGHCFEKVHLNKLKIVDLKYCDSLQPDGVCELTNNCKNITSLNLSMCNKLDGCCVSHIAVNLKEKLEVLKTGSITNLKDEALTALAENCPNLRVINFYSCSGISSDALKKVLTDCKINILDISYCPKVSQAFKDLSPSLTLTLTKLVCRGVPLSKNMVVSLCMECKRLSCIELCGVQCVDDKVIEEIVEIRGDSLEEIDLSWCQPITDKALEAIITGCQKLTALAAGFCEQIVGIPLKLLAGSEKREMASSLKKLNIGGCRQANTSVLEELLPACPNLEVLHTAGLKGMNDYHLTLLSRFNRRLRILNVKGCQQITDFGVCDLVKSCPVEGLVLSGIHRLTDLTIFCLASTAASTLEYLYLSGCAQISPHTVRYLEDVCVKGIFVEHRTPNAAPQQLMAKNLDTGEFCRADLMY